MQIGWGFCVRQRPALSLATRASTLPTLYLLRRSLEPSLGRAKHLARFTRYSVPTGADRPVFEPDSASQDALLGALLTLSEPESPPPGQLPGNQHSEGASEVSLRDHGSARKRIVTEFRARRTAKSSKAPKAGRKRIPHTPPRLDHDSSVAAQGAQSSAATVDGKSEFGIGAVKAGTVEGSIIKDKLAQACSLEDDDGQQQMKRLLMLQIAQMLSVSLEQALDEMTLKALSMEDGAAAEAHIRHLMSEAGGLLKRTRAAEASLAAAASLPLQP